MAPSAEGRGASVFRRVLQDRGGLLDEIADGRAPDMTKVAIASLVLSAIGGLGLGVSNGPLQAVAAAAKMPLVTLGALAVCFPAFAIFAALLGSRASVEKVLRVFAVGLGLRGAIIAGLAPLLLFFSSVGSPYGFLLLAGLAVFGIAECGFLRTVERGVAALHARGDPISLGLVRGWAVLYLAVAAQMTWSLRPFIRHPSISDFQLLGGPGGNMFTYVLENVVHALR
jgi:hypothetical protein